MFFINNSVEDKDQLIYSTAVATNSKLFTMIKSHS